MVAVRLVAVDLIPGVTGGRLVRRRVPGIWPAELVSCDGRARAGGRLVSVGGLLVIVEGAPGIAAGEVGKGAGDAGSAMALATSPPNSANRIPDLAINFTIIPGLKVMAYSEPQWQEQS